MTTFHRFLPALIALGLTAGACARTWTDAQSGREIEADLIGLDGETVSLKRSDGKTFELPLARLSAADQEFVKNQATAVPAAAKESASDWPTWRGTARDDNSPDTGLLKEWPADGPELLWTFDDAGKGYSSPAIVGGKIYVTGSRKGKAQVICIDAATGKELWGEAIGDDPEEGYNTGWGGGPRGAPTVSDGMVYAMSANGELACMSAEDGSRQWRKDLVGDFGGKVPSWGYSESPLVDGDKVVVTPGGEQGAIVAFDKKSGKKLWASKDLTDEAQYASLVPADVDGKRQYIQLFMKKIAGVDAENGDVIWTSDWKQGQTAVIPTPVYTDGKVYVTSGYGAGSKLVNIKGGKANDVWENKVMKNHHGGVVLVDGNLFGFSDGGGLVCQDLKTGEMTWNEKGEGIQKGTVHYADGMLYCMDEEEGSVFLIEATDKGFKEHGRFHLPKKTKLRDGTQGKVWTHPVVIGGRLYLRDQDLLFCYDVKG